MLNLFDIPMHDREGFIEVLERLDAKATAVKPSPIQCCFFYLRNLRKS